MPWLYVPVSQNKVDDTKTRTRLNTDARWFEQSPYIMYEEEDEINQRMCKDT